MLIVSTVVLALIAGGAGFTVWANTPSEVPKAAITTDQPQPPTKEELLRLVNEERAKAGVAPLALSDNIQLTAQWKADDMLNRNYFGHFPETMDGQPNTENNTVNKEMRDLLGKSCLSSSENISTAHGFVNHAKGAIKGWVESPPHYKAMVDPSYESIGFGVSNDYVKIVAHFCDEK